jgi:hypothetical protein
VHGEAAHRGGGGFGGGSLDSGVNGGSPVTGVNMRHWG